MSSTKKKRRYKTMAVTLNGAQPNYVGVSTDNKPAEAEKNSIFLELDTGNFYYFDGTAWQKLGA
jgi:hypothetical protein